MNIGKRLFKGLKCFGRIPEIKQCMLKFKNPVSVTLGYLQLISPPKKVIYKNKYELKVNDWADLTTAWVVLLGNEYRIFPNDLLIVDAGANIGAFVIFAAEKNAQAKIICLEPFPKNYGRLAHTIEKNHLTSQAKARSIALAGSDRLVEFDNSNDIASHSRKITNDPKHLNTISVKAFSLKTFMQMESIEKIDYLKMDIEGAEYEVLLNARPEELIKISRIGLEYHEKGHETITEHLKKFGFEVTYHPKKGNSGVIEYTLIDA